MVYAKDQRNTNNNSSSKKKNKSKKSTAPYRMSYIIQMQQFLKMYFMFAIDKDKILTNQMRHQNPIFSIFAQQNKIKKIKRKFTAPVSLVSVLPCRVLYLACLHGQVCARNIHICKINLRHQSFFVRKKNTYKPQRRQRKRYHTVSTYIRDEKKNRIK